jgi:hypothetical protein
MKWDEKCGLIFDDKPPEKPKPSSIRYIKERADQ